MKQIHAIYIYTATPELRGMNGDLGLRDGGTGLSASYIFRAVNDWREMYICEYSKSDFRDVPTRERCNDAVSRARSSA